MSKYDVKISLTRAEAEVELAEAIAIRDELEARAKPYRERHRIATEAAEAARVHSMATKEELTTILGGKEWFILKKKIGILNTLLNSGKLIKGE